VQPAKHFDLTLNTAVHVKLGELNFLGRSTHPDPSVVVFHRSGGRVFLARAGSNMCAHEAWTRSAWAGSARFIWTSRKTCQQSATRLSKEARRHEGRGAAQWRKRASRSCRSARGPWEPELYRQKANFPATPEGGGRCKRDTNIEQVICKASALLCSQALVRKLHLMCQRTTYSTLGLRSQLMQPSEMDLTDCLAKNPIYDDRSGTGCGQARQPSYRRLHS